MNETDVVELSVRSFPLVQHVRARGDPRVEGDSALGRGDRRQKALLLFEAVIWADLANLRFGQKPVSFVRTGFAYLSFRT